MWPFRGIIDGLYWYVKYAFICCLLLQPIICKPNIANLLFVRTWYKTKYWKWTILKFVYWEIPSIPKKSKLKLVNYFLCVWNARMRRGKLSAKIYGEINLSRGLTACWRDICGQIRTLDSTCRFRYFRVKYFCRFLNKILFSTNSKAKISPEILQKVKPTNELSTTNKVKFKGKFF